MKAGKYAVVEGREYQAGFAPNVTALSLIVPGSAPQPPGFEWSPAMGGRWVRKVPRSSADRLFEVETWALLDGRFPVEVGLVTADGRAGITYWLHRHTPVGHPPRDERDLPIIPPEVSGRPGEPCYFGTVDIARLTDVHESVHEHPLEPPTAPGAPGSA